jgi:chemotaxis protein CheD
MPGPKIWNSNVLSGPLSHYFDPHFDRDVVKIKPGESFSTNEPYIIATVLGSCVAACIRDNVQGAAGMNHFMLPEQGREAAAAGESASLRYGVFAMESLINEFIKRGSKRRDLEAKVFGGAAVVDAIHNDVGAQNAAFVIDYLGVEGIRTTAIDLGGWAPRKVYFFVEDGRVLVKYLRHLTNDTIERRDAEYARELAFRTVGAPVELF